MAELKLDEGQEKEFLELDNRLDVQFRQAVLQGLPQLALQMDKLHAKCVAITVCLVRLISLKKHSRTA